MKELNCKWDLKPTPGKAKGVQISFKECIKDHISRLHRGVVKAGNIIKIKLSGEGTIIGKRINNICCKAINFTQAIFLARIIGSMRRRV